MDVFNGKLKKGVITETWKRCIRWLLSCGGEEEERSAGKRRVAPEGCFTIYVGPKKQRFVIKIEYANHSLFQMLLEEAESEYGYNSEGPLTLPCDVDHFVKVLVEMDGSDDSYRLLSPSRTVRFTSMNTVWF